MQSETKPQFSKKGQFAYNSARQSLITDSQFLHESMLTKQQWANLKFLGLKSQATTDCNVEVFAKLDLPNLLKLDITNYALTAEGIRIIMQNNLPSLQQLHFGSIRSFVNDQGLSFIVSKMGDKLHVLWTMINCGITQKGMLHFVHAKQLKLSIINLNCNNISNWGAKHLFKMNAPELKQLLLNDCNIGDQGIKHIVKSSWPKLYRLDVSCPFGKPKGMIKLDGMQALVLGKWASKIDVTVWSAEVISQMVTIPSKFCRIRSNKYLKSSQLEEEIDRLITGRHNTA